jgi:hypothetical protein
MDAISETLSGVRGPPNAVAVLGASNYMAETLKPAGSHHKPQIFDGKRGMVDVAERRAGHHHVSREQASAALKDALLQTQAVASAAEPVHIHDLKDVADEHTRELVEKDQEVRAVGAAVRQR